MMAEFHWPSFMLGVLAAIVAGYMALAKVRYDDERGGR
jgi:hypothetical protein